MHWYKNLKVEADIGDTAKGLLAGAGVGVIALIISLYTGMPQQEAEKLVQNDPQQARDLASQAPPDVLEQVLKDQEGIQKEPSVPVNSPGLVSIEEVSFQISEHEGFEPFVYLDSFGNKTISYGFNLERSDAPKIISDLGLDFQKIYNGQQQISPEQGRKLLELNTMEAIRTATNFIPDLESHPHSVQKVIIDMAYNMGESTLFQFNKMRQAVLKRDYFTAANEMIDSKWYGEVGRRSRNLVEMMQESQ